MYGSDCRTFVANIRPGGLEWLETQENPGLEFCEKYMRQFGHLYTSKLPSTGQAANDVNSRPFSAGDGARG